MIRVIQRNNSGQAYIQAIEGNFYYVPVVDGKVQSMAAETEEVAMLLGLQVKYDGLNSQFCKFACRMLGIDSAWAEYLYTS